jgi:hypothetical protein
VTNATVGSSSIAPMVLPQELQKARLEYEEDRQVEGLPPVPTHSTLCAWNSTHVTVSEPECLRQLSHEHVCGFPGSPVARNLIEPHMQPPSYCLVFTFTLGKRKWCLRRLTFELSERRRQDARPGLAKMYPVPPDRAWWPAVGAPLERGVRRHS